MVFKKRLIFAGFFLIFLFGINMVSATQCFIGVPSCPSETTAIMKLSAITNAHGGTISDSSYSFNLCCPGTGTLTGTKVIGLSGTTNAHAESPTLSSSNYNTNILYSGFGSCELLTNCGSNVGVLSLSAETNAHLGNFNAYAQKICCSLLGEAPPVSTEGESCYGTVSCPRNLDATTCSNYECVWGQSQLCTTGTGYCCSGTSSVTCSELTMDNCISKGCTWGIPPTPAIMGNGVIESPEECDDDNTQNGDGCSSTGQIESGYTCTTANPSVCSLLPSCSANNDCSSNEECRGGFCYPIEAYCTQYTNYENCHDVVGCYYDGASCINLEDVNIVSCSDYSDEECNNDPAGLGGCALDETGACVEIGAVNYCRDYATSETCVGDSSSVAGSNLAEYGIYCGGDITCSCSWDDTAGCFPDYSITTGTTTDDEGNSVEWRGTCSFSEDISGDCNIDDSQTVTLTGTWMWDTQGLSESECQSLSSNEVSPCVFQEGLYYYDPGEYSSACSEGSETTTIQCPLQINLPFFGAYNFIATFMAIAIIYGILALKYTRQRSCSHKGKIKSVYRKK